MKQLITTILGLIVCMSLNAQVLITDSDYTTAGQGECNCVTTFSNGSIVNFFDSGNSGVDYTNNENEEITFCPLLTTGTKMSISFGINAGYSWNVDASDTVYVYDGPNTSSPLLGAHNSATDPVGFNHQASWGNTSGCLTVKFVSDTTVTGSGWDANVSCGNAPQPFTVHMEAFINNSVVNDMTPADTGYVDVCFGDSILFVGSGLFPHDSTANNPFGYGQFNQTDFSWKFSNGITEIGDSVWFTPSSRNGFLVELRLSDKFPQTELIVAKVRVSTLPSFAGLISSKDSICFGDSAIIIGGVTNTDTVGVDLTQANFQLGGSFAGLVYLPDGSGASYRDTISISGFTPGQLVTNVTDIQQLFINIEHSYLGDLEMGLTCPNGTQVAIFDGYTGLGELFPGGFAAGSEHLGEAYDDNILNPGIGWDYFFFDDLTLPKFSQAYNDPTYLTTIVNITTNPNNNSSIISGDYQVEQSYSAFIGCPLNGDWHITVQDNQTIDDGYIFEWGIFFDPTINPNNEVYSPFIVTEGWLADPSIVFGQNDTAITVIYPIAAPGLHGYTYEVTDNFGCTYDTIITIFAIPRSVVQNDTVACDNLHQISGTSTLLSKGTWSYSGPGTATFSPDDQALNPLVTVSTEGTYRFTFRDARCNLPNSFEVDFVGDIAVSINPIEVCIGVEMIYDVTTNDEHANYDWDPTNESTSLIRIIPSDTIERVYTITIEGTCNTVTDEVIVKGLGCELFAPNVITPNSDGSNDALHFSNIEFHPGSTLIIYNRWGKKIYESVDYKNDWKGQDVSDGTYYFILNPGGALNADPIAGTVTVLR